MAKKNSGSEQVSPRAVPAFDMRAGALRVGFDQIVRRLVRLRDQILVLENVGVAQYQLAALALAEELPRAADLQVPFGDLEAIAALEDHFQPRARRLGQLAIEQDADAVAPAAADAPAKLVQLREAEALGALDHHQRGPRHGHAHLDHRGADQELRLSCHELLHHLRLLVRRQATVQQADAQAGKRGPQALVNLHGGLHALLRLFDHRADPVRLVPLGTRFADAIQDFFALGIDEESRRHRPTTRRQLRDAGEVEVAVRGHLERTGNRRRAHHQLVRMAARPLAAELEALLDAEAMLLVDQRDPEPLELDVALDERMRSDDDLRFRRGQLVLLA